MIRALVRSSFAYGLVDFAGRAISFLAFPVFAHAFQVGEFGVIALVSTVAGLVSLLVNPGVNNALQRFYLEAGGTPGQQGTLVTTGFSMLAAWATVSVCAALLFFYALREPLAEGYGLAWAYLLPAVLACVPAHLALLAQDLLRLRFRPWAFGSVSLMRNALWVVLAVALVYGTGRGVEGYFLAQLLAAVAVLPLAIWLVRADFGRSASGAEARRLFAYGYPFIIGGFAHFLLQSADLWLLKALDGETSVGLYSAAAKLAAILLFVNAAMGQAWAPYALKAHAEDPGYRTMVARVFTLWSFVLAVGAGVVGLFTRELLWLLTPSAYWEAAPAASVLVFGAALAGTIQVSVLTLSIERRTGLIALCSWLAVGVNIALNVLLIPALGPIGSALANLATFAFLSGGYLYLSQRLRPIPLEHRRLAIVLGCAIALLVSAFVLNLRAPSAGAIAAKLVLLTATFAVASWTGIFRIRALSGLLFSPGGRPS